MDRGDVEAVSAELREEMAEAADELREVIAEAAEWKRRCIVAERGFRRLWAVVFDQDTEEFTGSLKLLREVYALMEHGDISTRGHRSRLARGIARLEAIFHRSLAPVRSEEDPPSDGPTDDWCFLCGHQREGHDAYQAEWGDRHPFVGPPA